MRVLTRHPDDHTWLRRYPNVQAVRGDVLDADSVHQAARGCHYVIHAAGYFRFWGAEADFDRTNVGGTQNVMAAALEAGVTRVVHISTVAVIGNPRRDQPIDETHPACPADPYQRSKLRAETLALDFHRQRGLPVIVLRPGAFYGPMGHYAFNRLFFTDPMRGIIMQVDGGRYLIFPVYIGDVAQSAIQAFDRGRVGEVYNICGDPISHREAFDIVCEEARLRWPRLTIPGWLGVNTARVMEAISRVTRREPFWPMNLRSYVYNDWRVSSDKAKRELGFAPTSFREGARRTIAWYRAGQPDHLPELDCVR